MSVQLVERERGLGMIPQIGRVADCWDCPDRRCACRQGHEAVYSHEGQFGEGPIYAVVCPCDSLTGYFTLEAVTLPLVDGVVL